MAKSPAWQRKEGKSKSGGLNAKGVASYRRANPGSKLKTAVTTKPSKLKKGSKAAKRRNLFLISLTISLIYLILSLKGADAGNSVFLIIGLLGFFSLFTTPILLFSFFINSKYELKKGKESIIQVGMKKIVKINLN